MVTILTRTLAHVLKRDTSCLLNGPQEPGKYRYVKPFKEQKSPVIAAKKSVLPHCGLSQRNPCFTLAERVPRHRPLSTARRGSLVNSWRILQCRGAALGDTFAVLTSV